MTEFDYACPRSRPHTRAHASPRARTPRLPATMALAACALALAATTLTAGPAAAQTDFYNLDKDRPLRVEDAYATKRFAFELKAAPLRLSERRDGALHFAPSLELKHGLLPGVEVSIGVEPEWTRASDGTRTSETSIELSSLANLWVEGPLLPALGVRVTGHLPAGSDADSYLETRLLATRGLVGPVRLHLNGGWLTGDGAPEDWWAGAVLDWVLPFHHTLLLGEVWLAEPASAQDADPEAASLEERRLHVAAGARHQLTRTLALDWGLGRSLRGENAPRWLLNLGLTHEFAIRSLIPGGAR